VKPTVLLIDLGSIYWAAWHSSANEEMCAAHDRSVTHIHKLIEGYELVAICCDSPHNFRKEIDPSYKSNRPPRDSAAYVQLARTKRTLEAQGMLLWEAEGQEADDVLAAACRAAVKADHEVVIASADKDLTQLVEHGVTWLSPKTGEHLDRDGVRKKFGVWPEQMRDYLALVGDQTDNVRGVDGVGPKGAAKLLGDYQTIEQLMDAVVSNPKGVATPKISAAIREALEWLPTTIKLVSLRFDAPIRWDEIYEPRAKENPVHDEPSQEPSEDDHEAPEPESEEAPDPAHAAPEASEPDRAIEIAVPDRSQAIVVSSPPPSWDLALEPTSIGAAFKLAQGLWSSGLYVKFKSAAGIWAVIIRGRELGLGALAALDCISIVEGRPCPGAHFLISRARRNRRCEYLRFIEGNDKFALWHGKAHGEAEIPLRYTIEQARKAGLVKPGSAWDKRPDEMLRKTAGVQLARLIAPDALDGLYSLEEMEGAA
jgi:5'-3' exonuclease